MYLSERARFEANQHIILIFLTKNVRKSRKSCKFVARYINQLKINLKNYKRMKPTLFVLAAGMGSRYGGLKQLDGLGPNGETIMDYSIFDAIRGGFGKIVFVIRRDFEQDFRDKVLS